MGVGGRVVLAVLPHGTFGNVCRHRKAVTTFGGRVLLVGKAKYPTVYRIAPHNKALFQIPCSKCH